MNSRQLIDRLPYQDPFLFVDGFDDLNEDRITGHYTFPENAFFYQGHFKDYPVTPGVILTECMAQIGVVGLGLYLLNNESERREKPNSEARPVELAMSNMNVDFFIPVLPGEKVRVSSEKEYFRFKKLKCRVQMHNESGKLIGKGEISGMIINK